MAEDTSGEKKRLRWGFLSTARINRALIGPLASSPRNELLAVASRSIERARAYALEWNIPRAYGSYEELLEDPNIDVVYISLPNGLHASWTIRAVNAGKHVLCEKPLAIRVSEVDAIIEARDRTGRVVAEAFMYRHHPQTDLVKEILDRGEIGNVHLIRGSFAFYLSRSSDVRLDASLGGGSLWDVGCYPVNFTRFLLGREPDEVFGWQVTGSSGVDVVFAGQMRFVGDVLAQFDCGFRSPFRASLELVGSKGVISLPNPFKPMFGDTIHLFREAGLELITVPAQELYAGEVEDMADAILESRSPRISLEDSRANISVLVALLESARTGKAIHL